MQAVLEQPDALDLLGHQILRLRPVHELLQPPREQKRTLLPGHRYLRRDPILPGTVTEELGERAQRFAEDGLLRRRLDLELDLPRVLNPSVAHLGASR